VNPCAKQLLDLGANEVAGQRLTTLPARVADTVYEVLQTGTAVREREVVLPGSKRPLHVSATRFAANGTGQANWVVVALVDDLTQIKLQQAQARELADRLSHELKNALVSVKIHAQLLPERYQDPEFREEFSRTMVNEVNRVDVLINNLTFFSHPLGLVHEPLDLGPLLDVAVKNLTQDCARRRQVQIAMFGEKPSPAAVELPMVTVKCIYQHKAGRVSGDRIRLAQAIEHLLRNAVQAMPQGGRLSVSTADATAEDFPDRQLPPGGAVRIDFQDTGEGIALENVSRVAEPFFTTRNVGVGLGLTIVKKIIERHCGELVVESTLEKGTKITLLLPVQQQPHPEDGMMNLLNETPPDAPTRRPGMGVREHAESQNSVH
jgi:signal transduction histidine kinase